ncbi:MAG TPA: aminotransferase class I/II-fold pyridoxal phosphate-dependent enzyme [Methylomusa anaerophila]|uniref:Putative pyridoxal phosphate-dependent aminotransferase EpsN n=1 Tax=Methylomusa anaerophila TaxID=1930071 RepID=A0A348AI28_9FIRM|nr:aminotransferase class I/II-fold pyridoxal phosphate-dependent enzyme [Methylomusa anaerophila]BBB90726.1 putative pyridoxal phosphate-dependent aminotransferase EpsN [Methylomusa anaerophila]HML88671.1 aminotransferase class I/II-fold pyridoxal phosphate-dependent enzyme [Methylomusa anaerophila]
MDTSNRIYLSPPHMGEMEQQLVAEAFATNWIAPVGPHVNAFEAELAEYAGSGGAVALSSGTAAIHLALSLLNVGPGDTVFCSTLTFIASANPITYQGAIPVFIDSEPQTWNMSPAALKRAFKDAAEAGKLPKAVIVVDLYGQSADKDSLLAICNSYGVPMLEDSAEALGATYKGKKAGTIGRFGVYSFNGNKIITTSGGGMLVSEDIASLEKARFWATQARDAARHYQHSEIGYNYRLSNVLAAIGRGQLRVLEDRIQAKHAVYNRYFEELSPMDGIEFMPEASYGRATRWLTVMVVDPAECGLTAAVIMDALEKENIESRPVWKPMHRQPVFANHRYYPHTDGKSISDYLFQRGICLPSGTSMTAGDQARVINSIKKVFRLQQKRKIS